MIARYRITIGGMYEPIARELVESGLVEVERTNAVHIFFRIGRDAVGLVRPSDDGWTVEVRLTDGTGGRIAQSLTERLRAHFEDYHVGGPALDPG